MRPGQGQRRGGRRNENRHGGGGQHRSGGQHGSQGHSGQGNQGQNRSAMSLRNQIFDSNGPDMRVRGNAFQVHEKYQALAKDSLSSGDRVLAENYLQHAEHYFRIIEAINEATAAEQRARQASWESQPQPNTQQGGQQGAPAYYEGNQQPQGERGMGEQGQDGQVQSEGRMERNPVQDLTQQDGQNGNQQQGNQGQQYQGQDGQQQQGGYQGNNQQRRNRDGRDNNRDGGRENSRDGGREFNRDRNRNNRDVNRDGGRDGNREGGRDNYSQGNQQGYGNQGGQPNQPHQQGYNQQPNTNQSADPLYDGVDEDGVDSPDTQAAVGGRR